MDTHWKLPSLNLAEEFMIRTALTTKLKLELTYREYDRNSPCLPLLNDRQPTLADTSSATESSSNRPNETAI